MGSHSVIVNHYGHTGCVNACAFEPETGRLATGSDDTKICIWSSQDDGHAPESDVNHPRLSYKLEQTIDTGHRANIFSVKWAPSMQDRLFSCAGDATVRVYDISDSVTSSTVTSNGQSWLHHVQSACVRVFRCHEDRVKRVATETNPDVLMTCAEDGQVRLHDLRTEHDCLRRECGPPLLEYPDLSLYSLSISKARPHLFVVAGTTRHAFLHDRRMIRTPMLRDWGVRMKDGQSTQCVRRFGVPKTDGTGEIERHVVATKLSDSNGRDLLVSYSSDAVYLFDIDDDPYVPPQRVQAPADMHQELDQSKERTKSPQVKSERSGKRTHEAGAHKKRRREEDDEPKEGTGETRPAPRLEMASEATGQQEIASASASDTDAERVTSTESPLSIPEELLEADDTEDEDGQDESSEEEEEVLMMTDDEEGNEEEPFEDGEDPDEAFLPRRLRREKPTFEADVPLVAPRRSYRGHANSETVKDVNFAFQDNLVVSGSDDGNFFCWDKESEELVGIFAGDSSVVNVMQCHPKLPIMAVSGIDETIKLFGPTTDPSKFANLIEQAEEIKTRNSTTQPRRFGIPRQALLAFLASQAESGEGPRFMVQGPEGEPRECVQS